MKMYVIIITDFFTECKYFSLHFPINMCYIVAMRTSKKKSKKKRRIIFIVLLCIMAAVIGVLGYMAYYMKQYNEFVEAYNGRFFEGTSVNGIDVAGKTVDEVEAMLEKSVDSYSLDILFRGDKKETISGSDIGYHYVSDGSVERLYKKQDAESWFNKYMKNKKQPETVEAKAEVTATYDEEKLLEVARALPELQEENMQEPKNAYMDYIDAQFVVVPEDPGTTLDKGIALTKILEAAREYAPSVDLTEVEGLYSQPSETVDTIGEELQEEADQLNQFTNASITYKLPGGREQTLDGTITRSWLQQDFEGTYYKDYYVWNDQINKYVESLAATVDTVGITRVFNATDLGEIAISGGNYGYQIDVYNEIMQLSEELENGTVTTREPVYTSKETTDENNGFGDDYVEVDCTRQHMWIYIDGEVELETDVVTGMMTESRATPAGVCLVYNKALDYTLTGPGYRTPVSYWMPFNGAVGFHDAWWRGAFGGEIYLWDGSHGCVNMPVDMAAKAFDLITFDMPIVVYYS